MIDLGGTTCAEALEGAEYAATVIGSTGVKGEDVTPEMVMEWVLGAAEVYQRGY